MDEKLAPAAKEEILTAASADFPDEVKKIRAGSILASERFPVALLNRMIEKTADVLRRPAIDVSHEIGRRGAENASNGVLRLALTLISMPSLLRKLQPVWQQLYSHGRTSYELGERRASVELHDFPYVSATQCARVTGMFEWFAQKAERHGAVRHVACRARGEAADRWEITW